MKLLFIYVVLVLAIAFYVWINILKEGNEDILTTNKVSPGITTIDRYLDNCPIKNNEQSYIYCIDGKIECQDIFGSTINNLGTATPYEFNKAYVGNTFNNTCGSHINKTNLYDYSKDIDSMGSGVYFDLSNCTSQKPWRVGTITKVNVSESSDYSCYESQSIADEKWNEIIHTKLNENTTYKVNDNVFVLASYLNSPELSSQGIPAMLAVIDANKPNTQSAYRTINGQKYYQATIYAITGDTFTISLSNLPQSQIDPLNITNIPKKALLKDSLYNEKTNSYHSDLTSSNSLRPVCKSGRFTSCLSKPPYTIDIENGIYLPTSDPLTIDGNYNMYRKQSQIDLKFKYPFSDTPNNPSGITDKDNLLQYNYFGESKSASSPFIKCVANHGSRVGDPLCCNQKGKIPDTKNICPQEVPTCAGYSISDGIYGYCT